VLGAIAHPRGDALFVGTIDAPLRSMEDAGQGADTQRSWDAASHGVGPARAPLGRIVVVDDNLVLLDLLAKELTYAGFAVDKAHDGIDALSAMYAVCPDLLLMDLLMPRMNGLELIMQVRAERRFRKVTLLAMSGHDGMLRYATDAGASEALRKPVSIAQVIASHRRQQHLFSAGDA
jgi:CheY-like chemotaxis protein